MDNQSNKSVFSNGVVIEGDLHLDGDVYIAGIIRGNVESKGDIEIDLGGSVKGDVIGNNVSLANGSVDGSISVTGQVDVLGESIVTGHINSETALVSGRVEGNIVSSDTFVLKNTGTVIGDVASANIGVELGATLKGHISTENTNKGTTNNKETELRFNEYSSENTDYHQE